MSLGEKLIRHVLKDIDATCKEELRKLNRTLQIPRIPFKRITHKEAVEQSMSLGYKTQEGDEISWESEAGIPAESKEPLWVYNYPATSRAWYYRQDLQDNSILRSVDLIYPEGHSEGSLVENENMTVKRY